MDSFKTILHPTDFSEHSRNAFELACSLATQYRGRVILLHVIAPPPTTTTMYEAIALHAEEASEDQARAKLDALRSAKTHLTMDYVLDRGNPGEVIIRIAGEADCDAIVMGTHGRSGLSRLLMGSVTEFVVRRAPCPVVTVKEPMPEEESVPTDTHDSGSNG